MVGRSIAPLLLRRLTETSMVQGGLVLATLGALLLVASPTRGTALWGLLLCGAGLSTVFPSTIAQLARAFGEHRARAAAVAFACAGLGGATMPWLVGRWSAGTGSLRAGLLIPVAGCVAMIALHAWRARLARRGGDGADPPSSTPAS
jgi:fucose permease